jgi:hypothetical protein
MEKYKHIEKLLEQFFEGYTSNTEEKQLYDFFAGNDVPEHLQKYKPIFACFEAGLEEFCEKKSHVHKMQYKQWILWPGVAAALLALVLLNPFGYGNKSPEPYEGSYIVCNGVCITDIETIRPELEAIVQRVLQEQEEEERWITKMMEMDIRFPDMEKDIRAHNEAILERFPDENLREEVRKILEEE